MRTVCVTLIDRANYGRLLPVMEAIRAHPDLRLQVVVGGSMVLERFGRTGELVEMDGYRIDGKVYCELEGNTTATMARSVGLAVGGFVEQYERLAPDIVLLIGDRYEALGAAIAAAYTNRCIVHFQGGETSGSIDESARHAITKLSHYHVPATQAAAKRIVHMGEDPDTIVCVGCPSSNLAARIKPEPTHSLLVAFHPTTTEYGQQREQMRELLGALDLLKMRTLALWPNIDAGSDGISKELRIFGKRAWLTTVKNLEPEEYLRELAGCWCAVGNSSSFVRDSSFFGTPVLLLGNRQQGRETAGNVTPCLHGLGPRNLATLIAETADKGRYPPSTLYGDGHVSEGVAAKLATVPLYVQKSFCDSEVA